MSVSIDATVRKWGLVPRDLQKAVEEAKDSGKLEDEAKKPDAAASSSGGLGMLTAEEEAELRELMENEEAELQDLMAEGRQ